MIGTTVLHYRILDQLGRGGMGEVFSAEDLRLGRTVALKFLPESLEDDPERRLRLLREAKAVSRLNSPYIATLHDIGEVDGRLFMIMELVRGEPLSTRIKRGPVSAADAAGIGVQILRALAEAHDHGVVHRDVKPSNVMVQSNGHVKVLDFGLAKLVEPETSESDEPPTVVVPDPTLPGMVIGTPWYMSPEQALGNAVDHRTDLFSAGIVLYEMLTAKRPFQGETTMQTINKIVNAPAAPMRAAGVSVPDEIERVVRRAMEKDPARRYQSADAMAEELEAAAPSGAIGAPYSTNFSSSASAPTLAIERPRATRRTSSVAVMTFQNIRRDPADDWIGTGIAETVTSDLKHVHNLSVVGRERVSDAVKVLSSNGGAEFDETMAIRVGEHVGASWIVSGGAQRVGDALRVTARFLDVATGTVVKTIKIDGTLTEIFDLQDRIVRELVDGLDLEIAASELDAIERNETSSIEAYKSFSTGLAELRTSEPASFDRAIEHLSHAVDLDQNYALAWAALGAAYALKGQFLGQRNLVLEALDFERKALHIDPENVLAYEWLGSGLNYLGQVDEAIVAFERAVALDPDYASAHAGLGRTYWLGKGDVAAGIASLERAVSLDPNLGYAYLQLAFLYAIAKDYERAEAAALRAVDLQQRFASGTLGLRVVGAHSRLGYAYYLQGRYEAAIAEYLKEREGLAESAHALRERTMIELDQKLGAAYLKVGREEEANEAFDRALERERKLFAGRQTDASTAYYLACLHALRGENDLARARLATVMEHQPAITPVRVNADPDLVALKGNSQG